jgi:hypothetical protein
VKEILNLFLDSSKPLDKCNEKRNVRKMMKMLLGGKIGKSLENKTSFHFARQGKYGVHFEVNTFERYSIDFSDVDAVALDVEKAERGIFYRHEK